MGMDGTPKIYYKGSRKAFIDNLISQNSYVFGSKRTVKVLDSSLKGNCLWLLREVKDIGIDSKEIILVKLSSDRNFFYSKHMSEECGVYYYSCPLRILKKSTIETRYSVSWKAKCYLNYALKKVSRKESIV